VLLGGMVVVVCDVDVPKLSFKLSRANIILSMFARDTLAAGLAIKL
jgi:hypothetical protein